MTSICFPPSACCFLASVFCLLLTADCLLHLGNGGAGQEPAPLKPLPRQPLRLDLLRRQVQALRTVRRREPVFQVGLIFRVSRRSILPWGSSDGIIVMLDILRAALGLFHESMRGIIARYRAVLVASIMFLLVGVVALSTATRRPCLQAYSGPWHTYKAAHMTESEQQESSVTNAAESAEVVVAEPKASPPRYVPRQETLPLPLPITFQIHHFRSPPVLD